MATQKAKSSLLKISGLWRHRKPDGTEFYSGSVLGFSVFVFPNSFARTEDDPEFVLYLGANGGERERAGPAGGGGDSREQEEQDARSASNSPPGPPGEKGGGDARAR